MHITLFADPAGAKISRPDSSGTLEVEAGQCVGPKKLIQFSNVNGTYMDSEQPSTSGTFYQTNTCHDITRDLGSMNWDESKHK